MDRSQTLLEVVNRFGTYALAAMRRNTSAMAIIRRLCVIVPNPDRQISLTTDFIGADYELIERKDDGLEQQHYDGLEFTLGHEEYHATPKRFRFLEVEDKTSAVAQNLRANAELMGDGFMNGKVGLALTPARQNTRSFDGQDFFDTDHSHVGLTTTWSNILPVSWSSLTDPTYADLISTVEAARARLTVNKAFGSQQFVSATALDQKILIVVHNEALFSRFSSLSKLRTIDATDNAIAGTFEVWLDLRGGTSNNFEVYYTGEGESRATIETTKAYGNRLRITTPKPFIFIDTMDPSRATFDPSDAIKTTFSLSLFGIYGYAAGWPQMAVQVQPTQA